MPLDHREEAVVGAFIAPNHRQQYRSRLGSAKARGEFMDRFYHMRDLDPRFARRIEPRSQSCQNIHAELLKMGAPGTCYVFGNNDLDQCEAPLAEALGEIVGSGSGTFISCVTGRLAYFEGEEPGERYILERRDQ